MKLIRFSFSSLALAAVVFCSGQSALADEKPAVPSFGALQATGEEAAHNQARQWVKATGNADADMMREFEAIWKQSNRAVIDRVADTFALGNPAVAKLLAQARNPLTEAPTKVPAMLTDKKASAFFRNNLALAYARNLIHRRVYEEALAALKTVRPENVVDPASYLFHRAVCEHALLKQEGATNTIDRLMEGVLDSPERYKTVSILMLLDMQTWKEKDLGAVARKMENIERRLDLARGGPQTQKLQKEVLRRLDEIIKELENKAKKGGGGGC